MATDRNSKHHPPSLLSIRRWRVTVVALVLCALCAPPSDAADISPTRFTTSNGMTVLVLEQHFLPIVEIHALIKAGSAQDPPEKAGLANLVAGLLDEGTTTRSSKQLAEQIDFVGGSLGAQADEDFTTASARILKKDIDLGFTLLADILQRPVFPKQEFDRVRAQILGEITSDNDDPACRHESFQSIGLSEPSLSLAGEQDGNVGQDHIGGCADTPRNIFPIKSSSPLSVMSRRNKRHSSKLIWILEKGSAIQNGQKTGCHRQRSRSSSKRILRNRPL